MLTKQEIYFPAFFFDAVLLLLLLFFYETTMKKIVSYCMYVCMYDFNQSMVNA